MRPLRCWRVRRRLQSFLDGEAAPHNVAFIASHLEQCGRCNFEAATLRRLIDRVEQLRVELGPDIAERLEAAVWRLSSYERQWNTPRQIPRNLLP